MKRRSPIRYKKAVRRVYWRAGRIREDSAGMAKLRSEAYQRSQGRCECGKRKCKARVNWFDGVLHHVIPRRLGGSDVLENVLFITRTCHRAIHGELHWRKSA